MPTPTPIPTIGPTFEPWFTNTVVLVKDIGSILSVLVTIGLFFLAIYGVRQWQRELRGRTELETARALIRGIINVRGAIGRCRSPVTMTGEFYNRERHTDESRQEAHALDQEYAYTKRLERLASAATEFESTTIEAEVLWGDKAVDVRNEVIGICNRITQAYMAYFPSAIRDARAGRDESEPWVEDQRRILFVMVDDPFGREALGIITRAITAFRGFLLEPSKTVKR